MLSSFLGAVQKVVSEILKATIFLDSALITSNVPILTNKTRMLFQRIKEYSVLPR